MLAPSAIILKLQKLVFTLEEEGVGLLSDLQVRQALPVLVPSRQQDVQEIQVPLPLLHMYTRRLKTK